MYKYESHCHKKSEFTRDKGGVTFVIRRYRVLVREHSYWVKTKTNTVSKFSDIEVSDGAYKINPGKTYGKVMNVWMNKAKWSVLR
jgi:hypothetical protein